MIVPIDIEIAELKVPQLSDVNDFLQVNQRRPIGEKEVSSITNYMNKIVRPYLSNRNHLNADIWIKGYECTRQKIFQYNRRFNYIALLNHIVNMVLRKSEKAFAQRIKNEDFIDDQFVKIRIQYLNQRSLKMLQEFEKIQKKDFIQFKMNAILPVILENIEIKLTQYNGNAASSVVNQSNRKSLQDSNTFYKKNENSSLENVEKLQWHLMCLLENLEKFPFDQCARIEKHLRKRIQTRKEISRIVLLKQNRLQNWVEHFKKHALQR